MNAKNRLARLATATGCVLWIGTAAAQGGPTSGMAGGPSNGYGGAADMPAPSRQNTPVTGGGPTTETSKSERDRASSSSSTGRGMSASADAMTGTISRVDGDTQTIELQGDRRIHVDPSTEIRRNGQKASFKDLHAGDDVRASFQGDDRTVVKQIDVTSNSGTSGSAAPPSSSSTSSTPPSSPSTGR